MQLLLMTRYSVNIWWELRKKKSIFCLGFRGRLELKTRATMCYSLVWGDKSVITCLQNTALGDGIQKHLRQPWCQWAAEAFQLLSLPSAKMSDAVLGLWFLYWPLCCVISQACLWSPNELNHWTEMSSVL